MKNHPETEGEQEKYIGHGPFKVSRSYLERKNSLAPYGSSLGKDAQSLLSSGKETSEYQRINQFLRDEESRISTMITTPVNDPPPPTSFPRRGPYDIHTSPTPLEPFRGPFEVISVHDSLPPTPPKGDPRFHALLKEIGDLHDSKQSDYGRETDPFANVRASEDFGIDGWVGCMVRGNDKMRRLQKAAQGGTLINEGVEDSLMDLAVYSLIGLILYRETLGQYLPTEQQTSTVCCAGPGPCACNK